MFQKAERKKSRLRLAICGPSGAGKTYGALMVAKGLGGKIAVIDTEHGSASLYSDLVDFDVLELGPPYSPARYIEAIKAAEESGFAALIIDSLSHAWTGEGGVLEMHDKAAKAQRGGNSFTAWREVTPEHNRLVNAVLASPLHIITTMRTKTAYEVVEDERGKKVPKKIGLAPVQRDGMEYEFTVVLDVNLDGHIATSSKDRTRLFDGRHVTLNADVGEQLAEWLDSGIDPVEQGRKKLESCKDLAALKDVWESLGSLEKQSLADVKEAIKAKLQEAA